MSMVDFTKEELEIMSNIITCWQLVLERKDMMLKVDEIKLSNKIDMMIENYCEHQWENHCCGRVHRVICDKCNKYLIENGYKS